VNLTEEACDSTGVVNL